MSELLKPGFYREINAHIFRNQIPLYRIFWTEGKIYTEDNVIVPERIEVFEILENNEMYQTWVWKKNITPATLEDIENFRRKIDEHHNRKLSILLLETKGLEASWNQWGDRVERALKIKETP